MVGSAIRLCRFAMPLDVEHPGKVAIIIKPANGAKDEGEHGHAVRTGEGLVGYAASFNQIVLGKDFAVFGTCPAAPWWRSGPMESFAAPMHALVRSVSCPRKLPHRGCCLGHRRLR